MSLVDPELAGRAIERALRRGGDLAEVYVEERHGFALTLDDGRVERPQSGSERGASIRVVAGEASYTSARGTRSCWRRRTPPAIVPAIRAAIESCRSFTPAGGRRARDGGRRTSATEGRTAP